MDIDYATIPLFGDQRKLYREKRLSYVVSSQDKSKNHPIYGVDIDIGSFIFSNDFHFEEEQPVSSKKNDFFSKKQESLE